MFMAHQWREQDSQRGEREMFEQGKNLVSDLLDLHCKRLWQRHNKVDAPACLQM